jgi:SAM-dependent methyltransferase
MPDGLTEESAPNVLDEAVVHHPSEPIAAPLTGGNALPYDGGFLEEYHINQSGILRLKGWTTSDNPTPPEAEGMEFLWTVRFDRGDIPRPRSGLFHDFLLRSPTATLIVDGARIAIEAPGIGPLLYDHLLTSDLVFDRGSIYGSGPSVRSVDDHVAELLQVAQGRVLDFGCGSGAALLHMRSTGRDAFGVDLDVPGIRRDVLPAAEPFVTFYDGDRLPFEDKSFDWVIATEVLEHIGRLNRTLKEIARVGRSLVMTVPDATGIARLSGVGVVPWHVLEGTHVNFFSPRSLRATLSRHYEHVEIGQLHNTETHGQLWSVNLWAIATEPYSTMRT